MATSIGINLSGKIFFSGLSAGTFCLGVWQTQRYFEKITLMEERKIDLALPPLELGDTLARTYQRLHVAGRFRHEDEILVGLRGPPTGALATSGPASGKSGGGLSTSPQGYLIFTPLEQDGTKKVILVNRGWIPQHYIKQEMQHACPTGLQHIVGIKGKGENPRFTVPAHNFRTFPPQFFWVDKKTMDRLAEIDEEDGVLLTQVRSDDEEVQYPAMPPVSEMGEFKTTPVIHAGYAFTWFGMATAGVFMTKKLMTRGRA